MKNPLTAYREKFLSPEKGTSLLNAEGKVKSVVVYPNYYRVGMSNLGFHTVYGILNEQNNIVCERAFLPEHDAESYFERKGNYLLSLETLKPLRDFHIIFISASFENDYINILKILKYSGIKVLSRERDDNTPLIVAGGIAVSANPEPIADFVDIFLLGDAEVILKSLCEELRGASGGESKMYFFKALSAIKGAYTPSKEEVPEKRKKITLSRLTDMEYSSAYSRIITPYSEFSSMHLVEMSRGCGSACRFCLLGNYYGSPRIKSMDKVFEHIDYGIGMTNRVGLISCFIGKGSEIRQLRDGIKKRGVDVSFSSIRFEDLGSEFVEFISESGQQTITLAPECGNESLRYSAGKKISNEYIIDRIISVAGAGAKNIKLYFLVGFPGETFDDIKDISGLVKSIKNMAQKKTVNFRIFVSASSFVPKPFTPLQWAVMDDEKTLKEKLSYLKRFFSKMDGVSFNFDLPKFARIQGILSRGDRKTGEILNNVLKLGGDWKKAMRESEINPDYYVHRKRKKNEIFPWDFIDGGTSKEKLYDIYQKNYSDD